MKQEFDKSFIDRLDHAIAQRVLSKEPEDMCKLPPVLLVVIITKKDKRHERN